MKKTVFQKILAEIRIGKSLFSACAVGGATTADFYHYLAQHNGAKAEYLSALADYADKCTDDIKEIVQDLKKGLIDNPTAKLLIDTEKWLVQRFSDDDQRDYRDFYEADSQVAEITVKFINAEEK